MQHTTPPAAHHHHHRWWRRRLRLLASVDFWLGVVIAVVALLGLITIFRAIAGSLAICMPGENC